MPPLSKLEGRLPPCPPVPTPMDPGFAPPPLKRILGTPLAVVSCDGYAGVSTDGCGRPPARRTYREFMPLGGGATCRCRPSAPPPAHRRYRPVPDVRFRPSSGGAMVGGRDRRDVPHRRQTCREGRGGNTRVRLAPCGGCVSSGATLGRLRDSIGQVSGRGGAAGVGKTRERVRLAPC